MQLTEEQFNEIQDLFPKPRGNVRWGHQRVLNGILYVLKHGCLWRSQWHSFSDHCHSFKEVFFTPI